MGQTLGTVVLFIVLLAMLPWAIKWLQRRAGAGGAAATSASRLVSALAVGPQQRVVTVEVGPEGARTWLVLGVAGQNISCLHSMPAGVGAAAAMPRASTPVMTMVEPVLHADDGGRAGV
ncbi:MAG TPA: flagellar biosynthetic protein FliO [Burkholderiaceae bacterium]|nr:flagellar biosynthetic protein FliO [Burkholderiaceae bacterium]